MVHRIRAVRLRLDTTAACQAAHLINVPSQPATGFLHKQRRPRTLAGSKHCVYRMPYACTTNGVTHLPRCCSIKGTTPYAPWRGR